MLSKNYEKRALTSRPMATLKEHLAEIGMKGTIVIQAPKGISIEVEVLDFKVSYGQNRWLVKPVAGDGQCWVEQITLYTQV